jgi:1-phosphofructokinase family hexose kinase
VRAYNAPDHTEKENLVLFTITPNPVLDKTITVQRIIFDEMSRAIAIHEDWGGKGFNVSRALRAMGSESLAMGFIGGATGQKLEQGLHSLDIKTDLVPITGETRTNIVITEAESNHYIKVNEAGPTLQSREIDILFERVRQKVKPGDLCALCGSLPPGIPNNFYADLVTLIQSCGARVLLDTSGPPLQLGLASHPFLVKPNAIEAATIIGCPVTTLAEAKTAALHLHQAGATMVALSLGAQGMILVHKLGAHVRMLHAIPPQVQVLHPTGAGDALLAGIIFALAQGLPMEDLACWGVASGTAAAMHQGVGVGTYSEIQRLAFQVRISEVWSYDE